MPRRITGKLHDRTRIAAEQKLRLFDGHLSGGKAGDLFEDVAQLEACFLAGAIRQGGNDADISEALGQREAGLSLGAGGALFLVVGVLERAEVARLRIERIEQAVKSAAGHLMQVGLVHIILLDLVEHFAIDGKRAEGFVVRGTPADVAHGDEAENNHGEHNDDLLCDGCHLWFLFPAARPAPGGNARL